MNEIKPGKRFYFGCAHGRFQPLHWGHLEYLLAVLDYCDHLIVGITNPDPTWIRQEPDNRHRHRPDANPFTFFERVQMVRGALGEAGVPESRFSWVPFPIHQPDLLPYYIPPGTVHFVRVFSPWEQTKVQRLRDCGWHVEHLHPGKSKEISALDVRRRIRSGAGWEHLVPPAVRTIVRRALLHHPERVLGS